MQMGPGRRRPCLLRALAAGPRARVVCVASCPAAEGCPARAQKEVKIDFRPVHNNPLYKEEMDTVKPFTRVY